MSFVKWLRRNNTKIMVGVIGLSMIGFIGGSFFQQYARQRANPVIAHYSNNKPIRQSEIVSAQNELEVLRALRAPDLLQSQRDLFGLFMSEVLFSEQSQASQMASALKRVARQNQYIISDSQIYEFYKHKIPSSIYWILLKAEAYDAGVVVPVEDAGKLLGRIIPQIANGATYSQFMPSLIQRFQIPEGSILQIFAQMLAVMQYAQTSCSMQDVTLAETAQTAAEIRESIDVSLAEIRADYFNKDVNEPTDQQIATQFDAYKDKFAADIKDDNPYGFGYKLSDAIKIEYMIVKLDDVSSIIKAPTQQDKEDYYQQNTKNFVESIPTDPNDPNSPTKDRTKTFAEVESSIDKSIRQQRTTALSNEILSAAADATEAGLRTYDPRDLTSQIYTDKAVSYPDTAAKLAEKYKIKIRTGSTGLLDASQFQQDEYLRRLYVKGSGASSVPLARVLYSVEELTDSNTAPMDAAVPKLYENVGPVHDVLSEVVGLVRVTKAIKAHAPENVDVKVNTVGLKLDEPNDPNAAKDDLWVVKDKVIDDLKDLAAMDIAKARAQEFKQLASKEGFDKAIKKFNDLYGEKAKESPEDPNVFKMQDMPQLQRLSSLLLLTSIRQNDGNPAVDFMIRQRDNEREFVDQMFALIPPDANSLTNVPAIMEFKPDMAYYCIKSLSMKRLWKEDYEKGKAMDIFRLDHVSTQSLAPVHFSPANIVKRMNFKYVPKSEPKEAQEPGKTTKKTESSK